MANQDLRTFLEKARQAGEVLEVKRPTHPRFGIPAVMAKLEQVQRYPSVYFSHVEGSKIPVLSNVFASRRMLDAQGLTHVTGDFGDIGDPFLWQIGREDRDLTIQEMVDVESKSLPDLTASDFLLCFQLVQELLGPQIRAEIFISV